MLLVMPDGNKFAIPHIFAVVFYPAGTNDDGSERLPEVVIHHNAEAAGFTVADIAEGRQLVARIGVQLNRAQPNTFVHLSNSAVLAVTHVARYTKVTAEDGPPHLAVMAAGGASSASMWALEIPAASDEEADRMLLELDAALGRDGRFVV